jgi:hypothetical protein
MYRNGALETQLVSGNPSCVKKVNPSLRWKRNSPMKSRKPDLANARLARTNDTGAPAAWHSVCARIIRFGAESLARFAA